MFNNKVKISASLMKDNETVTTISCNENLLSAMRDVQKQVNDTLTNIIKSRGESEEHKCHSHDEDVSSEDESVSEDEAESRKKIKLSE